MKLKSIHFGLLLGALAVISLCPIQANATATTVSTRPILFLHGFNVFGIGEDCAHDWSKMEDGLTAAGFTGEKLTIGYYFNDRNCDAIFAPKATILTSIESDANDLAWYIYNNFSSQGVDIDIVAHSMGGLLVRYALYRVAVGDSTYPPYLRILHAATMASPYTGYSLIAESCHIIAVNVQCWEMFPLSSFIEGLKDPAALVPQGMGGTLWSGIGSNADFIDNSDGFVTSASATSMNIPDSAKMILPWYKFVFHTGYTHNNQVIASVANSLALTSSKTMLSTAHLSTPKTVLAALTPTELASADAVLSRQDVAQDFTQQSVPAKTQPALDASGEAQGILVTNILPQGIFAQMGIQENDIVRGCNSQDINTPFEALSALENTKGPISMHFCIDRAGQNLSKTVVIQ